MSYWNKLFPIKTEGCMHAGEILTLSSPPSYNATTTVQILDSKSLVSFSSSLAAPASETTIAVNICTLEDILVLNLQSLNKVISWLAEADMPIFFFIIFIGYWALRGNLEVFLPKRLVDYFLVWQENGIYHHLGKSWSQAVKLNKIFISKNRVWETRVSPLVTGGCKVERKQGAVRCGAVRCGAVRCGAVRVQPSLLSAV